MPGRITVGNVDIVAVLDMVPPAREPNMMFTTTSSQDWDSHQDCLEEGQLQLYYLHFFLRSQGKVIMVDTGMGPGPHPDRGNRTGDLVNQLKSRGVETGDVDVVAHTHLHGDHVGWNVDYSGSQPAPTFPKARYLVPRLDWEHFTKPDVIGSAPQVTNSVIPLEGMGVMDLVDSEYDITDEVKTLSAPGHTPGHMVIVITSQGEKAMVVGDLLHSKAQVARPDWTAGVDTDKEASRSNRERILDDAEAEGFVIAAGHFHPDDHIGKVVRLDGRRYWQVL
jgi:glyoxylase-like metal-dependent hydrolase (beta-lactamase superfamily II)